MYNFFEFAVQVLNQDLCILFVLLKINNLKKCDFHCFLKLKMQNFLWLVTPISIFIYLLTDFY